MHTVGKKDNIYVVICTHGDKVCEVEEFQDNELAYQLCNYLNGGEGKPRNGGGSCGGYYMSQSPYERYKTTGGQGGGYE